MLITYLSLSIGGGMVQGNCILFPGKTGQDAFEHIC
jgi:hypothetical protein